MFMRINQSHPAAATAAAAERANQNKIVYKPLHYKYCFLYL